MMTAERKQLWYAHYNRSVAAKRFGVSLAVVEQMIADIGAGKRTREPWESSA